MLRRGIYNRISFPDCLVIIGLRIMLRLNSFPIINCLIFLILNNWLFWEWDLALIQSLLLLLYFFELLNNNLSCHISFLIQSLEVENDIIHILLQFLSHVLLFLKLLLALSKLIFQLNLSITREAVAMIVLVFYLSILLNL